MEHFYSKLLFSSTPRPRHQTARHTYTFAPLVTRQICTYYTTAFTRNTDVFGQWNFALTDSNIISLKCFRECFYIPCYSGNYKIDFKNNWIFILGWLCVNFMNSIASAFQIFHNKCHNKCPILFCSDSLHLFLYE